MPNKFIFADEAGCFTFNRNPNVSKHFVLCTVVMDDCAVGAELLNLRRRLAWDGAELGDYFHATTDAQAVRDEVFKTITKFPFTVQATIMEEDWLGHRSIQHTVRYTELSPTRFKDFWRD